MMQPRRATGVLLAALLAGTLAPTSAATASNVAADTVTVSTFSYPQGSSVFGQGAPHPTSGYQTVGQTIRVPTSATHLQDFAFRLYRVNALRARAYVYRWNAPNHRAYGHALYRSDVIDIPENGWHRVDFHTDLDLRAGDRYVLFVSVAQNDPDRHRRKGAYKLTPSRSYTDGHFVAQGGYGTRRWTHHRWDRRPDFGDMAFRMRFTR